MFPILCCTGLTYLAIVGQVMGLSQGMFGISLPVLAMVAAQRSLMPPLVTIWALMLGLMLDGLGRGPLGVHATTLIVLTSFLSWIGFGNGPIAAWRWAGAAFFIAWWDSAVTLGVELGSHQPWKAVEDELLRGTSVAAVTGMVAMAYLSVGQLVFDRRAWKST